MVDEIASFSHHLRNKMGVFFSRILYREVTQLVLDMTVRQKRLSLKGFNDFHYKWGKLWAFAKNRPISKLIVDVFEARIEANKDDIEMMVRDIAEQRGITYEELVSQIMNGEPEDEDEK